MARHDQFNRPDVGMAAIGGIAVSLRGVAYDLMQLNPDGIAAENFVIDPFSPPGVAGALPNIVPGVVGPYVCTGQLGMPRVTGGALTVGRPFPLAPLFNQFNSRFDQYTGALCSYSTAPPDTNIRQYAFGAAGSGTPWMSVAPAGQVAQSTTVNGKLWTVADPLPQPPGTTRPILGAPVTDEHIRIDYLALSGAGGTMSEIPAASLPSCPANNRVTCMQNPYGPSCIRLVRARLCDPADTGQCVRVAYQPLFSFIAVPLSLPSAPAVMTVETLGAPPGRAPCP